MAWKTKYPSNTIHKETRKLSTKEMEKPQQRGKWKMWNEKPGRKIHAVR